MANLIGYKTFKTTSDFEKWQIDNPELSVFAASPIMLGADINLAMKEGDIQTSFGVFVTHKVL